MTEKVGARVRSLFCSDRRVRAPKLVRILRVTELSVQLNSYWEASLF